MSDRPLHGAVALVTGASSGIGAATARRLAREGAAIALLARRGERLDRLAGELTTAGSQAIAVATDITEPALAYQAVEDAHDRFGRLDVVVNSAGLMVLDTALHTPIEEWDRMISLNVSALVHITHAALPYLIDAAATSPRMVSDLINVGSLAGRIARPIGSVYSLTRFGLNGFTESLRQELLSDRVRVSVVAPGTVDATERDAHGTKRDVKRPVVDPMTALRPADVADAIAYIVTRERHVAVNEMVIRAGGQTC
ncbi:SDR family NAD(P)-dependent oxidoreductase [Nocardia tengchongensis]|uniref:SDR family NAD(P)-dependent oxidoreductase n=1 Tax=Nocardia tengchongensis TaxID=2055889 RepID=A0ABX8CY63_9NOCA|nr:SDR family NAD(P)-dependent oxidoreductase [Nocardia tengchongensis]QVI23769.1 SDR family NAD(P)-dependent oxidoreductase [Nocardia tengchongensis]